MSDPIDPSLFETGYWDRTAWQKRFTHPLDSGLLAQHVPRQARMLDYGCGYGRVLGELVDMGYGRARGCDASDRMIDRARTERPGLELHHVRKLPLPFEDRSHDAVVLFSVLTCVLEDGAQRDLIAELLRTLQPGGVLYVSDLLLQEDERNLARYDTAGVEGLPYGCFQAADEARFRHMKPEWLEQLFEGLERVHARELTVHTMNGNPARAFQWMLRKP